MQFKTVHTSYMASLSKRLAMQLYWSKQQLSSHFLLLIAHCVRSQMSLCLGNRLFDLFGGGETLNCILVERNFTNLVPHEATFCNLSSFSSPHSIFCLFKIAFCVQVRLFASGSHVGGCAFCNVAA
jgi:hypothetical protein